MLSALLFLGSLRVLLIAFETADWPRILAAGCLTVLVFNDMLATSHTVESESKIKYTLPLMIIDLCNFLFLALAMVVISPSQNLFDVALPKLAGLLGQSSFWLLLTLYWLCLMLWTHISQKALGGQSETIVTWQFSIAGVFCIEWLICLVCMNKVASVGRLIVLLYLTLYMVCLRPLVRRSAMAASGQRYD